MLNPDYTTSNLIEFIWDLPHTAGYRKNHTSFPQLRKVNLSLPFAVRSQIAISGRFFAEEQFGSNFEGQRRDTADKFFISS